MSDKLQDIDQRHSCPHCSHGYFEGSETECVNGVLIDVDEAHEGWQRDVNYPAAPCEACAKCQGSGQRGRGECRACNGTGWKSGRNESQERLEAWAAPGEDEPIALVDPAPLHAEIEALNATHARQADTITRLTREHAEVVARLEVMRAEVVAAKAVVRPMRCPKCGLSWVAFPPVRVDELVGTRFQPGPFVRCVECKALHSDPLDPATDEATRSGRGGNG